MSLREKLPRKAGTRLFAVLAALALWVFFSAERRGQETLDAAVRFVYVPEDMEVNPDQIERISAVLEGPRSALEGLRRGGLTLLIDCSDVYDDNERTITLTEDSLRLPPAVQLVKAVPSQLRFTLEKSEAREVEVAPSFVGAFEEGYAIEGYTVNPPRLTVVGPAERVRLVEQVSTDPVDVSDVIGGRSFRTTAFLADPYLRFRDDPIVTVEVRMRKR